ncbi:MAG: FHA domain-containing protein [Kiritimatiellia bacterium]
MRMMTLLIKEGPSTGEQFTIPEAGATVGRSRLADFHIEDGRLSRLHCRLSYDADLLIVQDLGSSNGTSVNGQSIGEELQKLLPGDLIALGDTVLEIKAEGADPSVESVDEHAVDLGLSPADENKKASGRQRRPLLGLMIVLAVLLIVIVGAGAFFMFGQTAPAKKVLSRLADSSGQPFEFRYERLSMESKKLFRYILTYDAPGVLTLSVDDLGDADRSFSKSKVLNERAREALKKEIIDSNYTRIGELLPERSADSVTLRRRVLTIVLGTEIWTRTAENASRRDFDALCERLETFGRNELGAWATQFSVGELREMGREQLAIGDRYWEQRDLGDEKLFLSLVAYKKGLSALETLNPKPDFAEELQQRLHRAEKLLNEHYEEASFTVDQALNTQRYEAAAEALRRICRMISDREDERNIKATEKLRSVESRFLKGGR